MSRYLDKLRQIKAERARARSAVAVDTLVGLAATSPRPTRDDRPSPSGTLDWPIQASGASPAEGLRDYGQGQQGDIPSPPEGFCSACGSGFWVRPAPAGSWQCGRCSPAEHCVESVLNPGGSMPPPADAALTAPVTGRAEIHPAPSNAKPIYWETGDGRILGPAIPEFLARDGETFWISTTFEGEIRWINADRLRAKGTDRNTYTGIQVLSRQAGDARPGEVTPPVSPLPPGCLVTYRGKGDRLSGGALEREKGTVLRSERTASGWVFHLTDGTSVPASTVVGVAQTNDAGEITAVWTVRAHGLDGERTAQRQGDRGLHTISNEVGAKSAST